MRVVRFSHSGVVSEWRQRDRELIALDVDVSLLCAATWNEGGAEVAFAAAGDRFARGARTFGRHPNLFLFDPRAIWHVLDDRNIDLIDLHEEPFSLVAAEILFIAMVRRRLRPFVVYTAQNLDRRYPPPFGWIERIILHSAAGAYPCNVAAGDRLRRRGLRGVVAVLPLGVDVDLFRPDERDQPSDPLRVAYFGRLARHKGVHVLLEAIGRVEGATLDLIGDGPAETDLVAQRARLGLDGRVRIVGFRPYDELAELYRAYDIVVVPSLPTPSWTEQFCRVAVEAMASGVPVIASGAGALPGVIGDAGILVAPGDPQAIADAIVALAEDPARWCSLRERGLERSEQFRWAAVAASQAELYRQVLERAGTTNQRPGGC